MPYLTPEELPEERACRALLIPDNYEWLALISGALTELTKEWNWEQWGAVSISDTVTEMQEIINGYYNEPCGGSCPKMIRIGINGQPQQSTDGGETWEDTTGDEAVPPLEARTEPTAEDRRCIASANAANVLALVYEEWVDTWSGDNNLELVAANFAILVAGLIGAWLGLITAAAINLAIFIWGEITTILNQATADMWDSDFADIVKCALYENSTDTAGVVTFDYQGFLQSVFDAGEQSANPIEYGLLVAQINYVVYFIGAAGLNHAGETTAIETAECDECQEKWCYEIFITEGMDVGTIIIGSFVSGSGLSVVTATPTGDRRAGVKMTPAFPATVRRMVIGYTVTATGTSPLWTMSANNNTVQLGNGAVAVGSSGAVVSGTFNYNDYGFYLLPSRLGSYSGGGYITYIRLEGDGDNPFGDNNCTLEV